ncbi:MAG: aminopeptidase P family protein [Elusimicrobia bacterium]|nr:aminopeptidase P family protein [Elusimicrobiota bacterium]
MALAPSRSEHRRRLAGLLSDGLILAAGNVEIPRTRDATYEFWQDSNFLYLTGIREPGYALLICPKAKREILLVPRLGAHYRVWEGGIPGPRELKRISGVAEVRYLDELPKLIGPLRGESRVLYSDRRTYQFLGKARAGLSLRESAFQDAFEFLRAVKSREEIAELRKANAVAGEAHLAVMAKARPGLHEYELKAEFDYACRRRGSREAYPAIVAAGRNAAVLHYRHDQARIEAGDLILVDAGAEHNRYASDVTRTFPASGHFSERQRDIYSIVLEAQNGCIERARPGVTMAELHRHCLKVMAEGLRSLRLVKGSNEELADTGALKLFFPHGLGHMLGLDVHDAKANADARLEAGFVITVEPGIYFNPALFQAPELRRRHKGRIAFSKANSFMDFGGVRLEDDVVVQPDGPPLNLTTVPKGLAEIEDYCGRVRPPEAK